MKRPTFQETVDVLVKAYFADELEHKVCSACAVGNIVAHALGTKPKLINSDSTKHSNVEFDNGDCTSWYRSIKRLVPCNQTVATGYTVHQLRRIEYAFEHAPGEPKLPGLWFGKTTDPTWMFNGLMAVLDVLAEIHGVDLSVKESAKLQFVKP